MSELQTHSEAPTESDAADMPRLPWQRPTFQKLDAREAEAGANFGPDAVFS